jgi:outer membrane protein OmpA-like peptidoglycan-associated protein
MFKQMMSVGVAALVLAAPASAQERGTVEFGGFVGTTSFDKGLGLNNAYGAGGRIGAFLHPRLSLEFEGSASNASRSFGLKDVNVGVLSARLTAVPARFGRVSVLVGAGIEHTDTYFLESYGVHGLLGAKVALSDAFALRVDGLMSYMMNKKYTNTGLRLGIATYRNPFARVRTVTRIEQGPAVMTMRQDSVSAYETRRLRASEVSYRALRDSLNKPTSSAAALVTMKEMIYFENDKSELSDSAKAILSEKVTVFRANPAMRIVITGFASQPGSDAYNMALGTRRADAAKAYLVSQGVESIRIEIATRGEGQLVVEGPGELANAENRRGQFRLLIADPYLVAPKKK